jgi:hypothetical protein
MNDARQTTLEVGSWPLVSILFITYKRIDLLEQAVAAIRQNTDYPNLQVVISDDASPREIQERMRALPADVHLLPTKNRGLGANINRGLTACQGKYILMVQDDWMCQGPSRYLRDAVTLMEAQPVVGLVSFTLTLAVADRLEKLDGVDEKAVLYPVDPEERDYPFTYSDQPHVRRSAINEMMGPYLEDMDVRKCEMDYERRWEAQTQYRSAMFPSYTKKVFSDHGVEQSFRENRVRNKIDRALLPIATKLRDYPVVFRASRAVVRGFQTLLERLRIARV